MKPPGLHRGFPVLMRFSRSWPEVALPAEDAGPHFFRRRVVEPARTTARTAAGESDQGWIILCLDLGGDARWGESGGIEKGGSLLKVCSPVSAGEGTRSNR